VFVEILLDPILPEASAYLTCAGAFFGRFSAISRRSVRRQGELKRGAMGNIRRGAQSAAVGFQQIESPYPCRRLPSIYQDCDCTERCRLDGRDDPARSQRAPTLVRGAAAERPQIGRRRGHTNSNSVTYAELASVWGSALSPRCSRSRRRSPCSGRPHRLRPRLRRLHGSARRRAAPGCRQ
jgi:hypothetical protein